MILLKGYLMRFYGKRYCGIAVAASFFVAGAVSSVYAQQLFIQNPYAGVNWGTWGQYKAQFHVHSTNSDGDHTRAEMLEEYYTKGFNIVSFHEHDFLTTAWDGPGVGQPTAARIAQMAAGQGRSNGRGMIGIANTNEHSASGDEDPFDRHHINTFNAAFRTRDLPSGSRTISNVLARAQELGGISHINHPGRYTGGQNHQNHAAGAAASNNPVFIKKYVDLFMRYESCVGMEIINKFDAESRSDRILWDNILKQTMPGGRGVWGFSNDDSHSREAAGFSYNMMLMPELTEAATINAMKAGAFYAVSYVDRRENIPATTIHEWQAEAKHAHLLGQTVPSVTNVTVSGTTITITGTNFTTIDWIADGVKIATGNSINISTHPNAVNSYVRAQLKSAHSIAYLQPFGVRRPSVLASVIPPAAMTGVTNGVAKTAAGLGLPAAVEIGTAAGHTMYVPVSWNVAASAYDPTQKTEQTFTVGGAFTLPEYVTNGNNIPLTVTVSVTVKRELTTVVASKFGDSYYRYGQTNSEFRSDAFDMSALAGWTLSPTSVGFGRASTSAELTLATTLADGTGPAEAGASNARHTWVYFKKEFSLPDNIVIDEILGASGDHRIDDALIIYINGVEVYRYNVGGRGGATPENGATVVNTGAPVNWASYTGYNTNATTMFFSISSDYDDRETDLRSVSGEQPNRPYIREAASLANLRSALKPGVNVITCLVGQNAASSSDLWFDLDMSIEAAFVPFVFVPVTDITGVPTDMTAGEELQLVGTAEPANATNMAEIVWSIEDAGTTGAVIDDENMLSAEETGTVTVRATIANGAAPDKDYTQDFTITVTAGITTPVLSPDKVIVGVDDDVAVVARPGVLAGGFSAGPNPVAKSSGRIDIFRHGGRVDGGVLTVYDASGNVVQKFRINDNADSPQPRRIVGTWDLTDRRGRPVPEGAYLVRGTIKANGKKERVSLILGVR